MKYTNKHIKESYLPYQALLYIFSAVLVFGIFLLLFGFIATGRQMGAVAPLGQVLTKYSNPANKTAYLETTEVPQKIAESKSEDYYLVDTQDGSYVSGMQENQYAALKAEVEETGGAKLSGMTKVVVDETVLADTEMYLNDKHIFLWITKLTYGGILKEGYLVNLILGGLAALVGLIFIVNALLGLKKYKNPRAKQIDEECNRKSAKWISEYKIYLTDSFLVSLYDGLIAIDIGQVRSVTLRSTERGDVIMDAETADGNTVGIFKEQSMDNYIYEEEKVWLETIFKAGQIDFICEMEICN